MYSYTPAGAVTAKRLHLTRQTHSADLEADYTYDNEGHPTSVQYPSTAQGAGPLYRYGYDAMGRLSTMSVTQNGTASLVTGVNYGPADELLQINGSGGYTGETRSYNALLQLTSITAKGVSMQYTYPSGANIGKISQQTDALSGETVQYQYDSLGRLMSAQTAAGPTPWGYSYGYDGFGNLLSKTVTQGSPSASLNQTVNPATNRVNGQSYDANGNQLSVSGQGTALYDVENRLTGFTGGEQYGYDPGNKRIQKQLTDGSEQIHFYGADGRRLGIFPLMTGSDYSLSYTWLTTNTYFAGELIQRQDPMNSGFAGLDRLGSVASDFKYYPYGEERQTTGQNLDKFATYYRDQTGLDYADQRYYSSIMGRFLTPDRTWRSADPTNPQTWNRYSYVQGDPVNLNDPSGLMAAPSNAPYCGEDWITDPSLIGPCTGPDFGIPVSPRTMRELRIQGPLESLGNLISSWHWANPETSAVYLKFQSGSGVASDVGEVAAGLCVAQPELCVAVGLGATIYVTDPYLKDFITTLYNQLTARAAVPVTYAPYNVGRDSKGKCNDVDPKKKVKWRGSDDQHWHYIEWNVRQSDCMAFPKFQTGPDPGPAYTEIPR